MTGASAVWDEALAGGRLLLQRTSPSAQAIFPPREMTPLSGEPLEWFEASGFGTIYSLTWIQRRPPEPASNVVIVELAEGARMMGRVEGADEATLRIGMAVRARIAEGPDGPLVVFDLVEAA